MIYDVCVAGFGAWGAATASALANRGLSAVVLDPHDPPHEHGSHTGRTRLARRSAHEGTGDTPITSRAFELWDGLEREQGTALREITGALLLDQPDGGLIAPSCETFDDGGWSYEQLDRDAMRVRWPGVLLCDGEIGLYEPGASIVYAAPAVRALGDAARAAGAEVRLGTPMSSWRPDGPTLRIHTPDDEPVQARRLVVCVGNRAPELAGTGWPLEVERQVLVTYRHRDPLPAIFAVDPQLGEGTGCYGCPEPDTTYNVALHHEGLTGPFDTLPREVSDEDLRRVTEDVARRVPELTEVVDAKVCTYTSTPDHHWILDHHHPADRRVVVGSADFGRGLRFAPAIGELLADLVCDTAPVPAFLRADRLTS